ncbi:hypothetical protein [Roseateles sp. PN1]|uniref:hypothetical protein n=1 Tax=Roseateles sp. PN1 TaxID=3137372 RepID=UPI00313990D8
MSNYKEIGEMLKTFGFKIKVSKGKVFALTSIYKEADFPARMMGLSHEVLLSSTDEESFSESVLEFYDKVASDYRACGVAI